MKVPDLIKRFEPAAAGPSTARRSSLPRHTTPNSSQPLSNDITTHNEQRQRPRNTRPSIQSIPTSIPLTSIRSITHSTASNGSSSTLVESNLKVSVLSSNKKLTKATTAPPDPAHPPPVPLLTILSRGSAPLFLPGLDQYLNSLAPPKFPPFPPNVITKDVKPGIFPPMDRLVVTGKSLQDLETNNVVAPFWRNRSSILSSLVSAVIGATGSSLVASFYSLHGVFDTVQIFALILSTAVPDLGRDTEARWKQVILGTIPNILAFNFTSTLIPSLLFLLLFMTLASLLLYYFFVATNGRKPIQAFEGLQQIDTQGWALITVTFVITLLYLPLSTIAVHALVWSDDFWVVANPYTNTTTFPPILPPLGPPEEYRDPLDFCYTTTMKRNEVNFAPIVVIISFVVVVYMAFWFPLRLRYVIEQSVPAVDKYTEVGAKRNNSDMDREYQRLLERDNNPITFLYNDFRRGWGAYRSFFLFAKLSALFIIAIIDPDNCLFRSLPRNVISLVRQGVLILAMIVFFLLQCFLAPFLDPVSNASEWTSRLNYVLTALVGLAVALNIPGKAVLDGPILYVIYIVTYGLTAYFAIIHTSWMRRLVKRWSHRIDFSIDVFSPRLDLSKNSFHVTRRIWQESLSVLFLTDADCGIPQDQPMNFAKAPDAEYPPYLLSFKGTPAERYVENLKILREVGSLAYNSGVTMICCGDVQAFYQIQDRIQRFYVGPDCWWKKPGAGSVAGQTRYFGNAWWIPFPPTLVIRYDDGPLAVLKDIQDLREYVTQNESEDVRQKRQVRMALRSLDGVEVRWPYDHHIPVGNRMKLPWIGGHEYYAQSVVRYHSGVLKIGRQGELLHDDLQLGSGFDLEIEYAKDVHADGGVIGLNDDYELTPSLCHFLEKNFQLIQSKVKEVERKIQAYRDQLQKECDAKAKVLSYPFLTHVYNRPQSFAEWNEQWGDAELDTRVRHLVANNEATIQLSYERVLAATSSEVATWWYIFWDDLWRRNSDTIGNLQTHEQDFNPHYMTSIAYTPLSRPLLETFLVQRGLISTPPKWSDPFHSGFLNKIYLRLNEIVFHDSSQAILYHIGNEKSELDLEEIDLVTQARSSTLGTGGGTDHDDSSIRARPAYKWEGILDDPLRSYKHKSTWASKLGAWFGISPLWRTGTQSKGLAMDVRLDGGKYVLMAPGQ